MKHSPFHYELKATLFAFNGENITNKQEFRRIFNQLDVLQAREDAFLELEELIDQLHINGRIELDKRGNRKILQPQKVRNWIEELKKPSEETYQQFGDGMDFEEWRTSHELKVKWGEFEPLNWLIEFITISLVIDDATLLEEYNAPLKQIFEEGQKDFAGFYSLYGLTSQPYEMTEKFELFRISSSKFDEEQNWSALLDETEIYDLVKIPYEHNLKTIQHFGLDFDQSGGGMTAANCDFLPTPHIWCSLEEYNERYNNKSTEEEVSWATGIENMIRRGETDRIEFKPALLYNFKTGKAGIGIKHIIARTLCSFMNTNGGFLLVGVEDDGTIQGLEKDYSLFTGKNVKDEIRKEVDSVITWFIGKEHSSLIETEIVSIQGKDLLVIYSDKSPSPICLNYRKYDQMVSEFYIRMNASTHQLNTQQALTYCLRHFNKSGEN